jgi:hypothetical protein
MDTGLEACGKRSYRGTGVLLLLAGGMMLGLTALIGISDNPPGIALMLAGLLCAALGVVYGMARPARRTPGQQLLYWSPRALCVVFALFIGLFALDVFQEGSGFWRTTIALLVHLIPTFLLLFVLAVSWRREWIAGILFPLLGVLHVVWSWNKPFGGLSTFSLIAGPLVLTGALFLVNWHYRGRLRERGNQ